MRAFSATVVFSIFAGLSSAQIIDPDSVDINIRQTWCVTQQTSCPLLCLQGTGGSADTASNDCDAETLQYSCVCANGLTPNASEYSQTIPYYECTEFNNQCVANCGSGNNACADKCRTANPCGAQNPVRVNTTTSTTMSATATGKNSASTSINYSGFGSNPTATSTSNKNGAGALALEVGKAYGLGVVVAGLLGGFALML